MRAVRAVRQRPRVLLRYFFFFFFSECFVFVDGEAEKLRDVSGGCGWSVLVRCSADGACRSE